MIIDTHVHFGSSLNFNLKKKTGSYDFQCKSSN